MANAGDTNEFAPRFFTFVNKYFFTPSNPPPKITGQTIRFGLIAAAKIAPAAIIFPAQYHPEVEIVAIGARTKTKAVEFAKKWGIKEDKAYAGYDAVLADTDVDAVYIGLPNGLHAEWAMKSLQAGKHVLLEKPFVSNTHEARAIDDALRHLTAPPPVILEAFHYRFHPATIYLRALLASGTYGKILSTHASLGLPGGLGGLDPKSIRFSYELGGGALMDLGYTLSITRYMILGPGAGKPKEIVTAMAKTLATDDRIDQCMEAQLLFEIDDGAGGKSEVKSTITSDLAIPPLWGLIPKIWEAPIFLVETERAHITYYNYVGPHVAHSITIKNKATGKTQTEKLYTFDSKTGVPEGLPATKQPKLSTYGHQLFAFVNKIKGREVGPADWIPLEDSIAEAETIDAIYEKAGLPIRTGTLWEEMQRNQG